MDSLFPHTSVFPLKKVIHWIPITPDSFLSLETNILFLCLKKKNLSQGFQLGGGWESLTLSIVIGLRASYVATYTLLLMQRTQFSTILLCDSWFDSLTGWRPVTWRNSWRKCLGECGRGGIAVPPNCKGPCCSSPVFLQGVTGPVMLLFV